MSTSMKSPYGDTLPTPPGIGYRGKALAKFSLLTRGFPLLVPFACLLLRTWT